VLLLIDEKQNIDSELKFLTEKFIISNSYKLVSRFWHILSIKGYKKFNLFLIKYKHFNKNKIKVNLKGDKLYMVKL